MESRAAYPGRPPGRSRRLCESAGKLSWRPNLSSKSAVLVNRSRPSGRGQSIFDLIDVDAPGREGVAKAAVSDRDGPVLEQHIRRSGGRRHVGDFRGDVLVRRVHRDDVGRPVPMLSEKVNRGKLNWRLVTGWRE